MALNKKLKNSGLLFEKLGYIAADSLYQQMRKSADYYYIGFLTQVGVNAPTNKILYTDFLPENGITFTYEGTGKYRMYCNLFKPGYVEVEVNEGQNDSPASSVVLATVYDGYVEFTALDGGSAMDNILNNTPVKVKVWLNTDLTVSTVPSGPPIPPLGTRLWAVVVNDGNISCFTDPGWDFAGQGVNFAAAAATFGGQYVLTGASAENSTVDECSTVVFMYEGINAPPDFTYFDPNNGPVTLPFFMKGVDFGCLVWDSTDLVQQLYEGIYYNDFIYTNFSAYGPFLDFDNDFAGAVATLNTLIQTFFPYGQVTVTADGGGFYTIKFSNVWYDPGQLTSATNGFAYSNGLNVTSINANVASCV